MYPLEKVDNEEEYYKGYRFQTVTGVIYEVYFSQLLQHVDSFQDAGLEIERFYYFGFQRLGEKKGARPDIFIKRTITITIFQFFIDYPEGVLIFNYSNSDNRIKSRRKKFREWFDEYSESTKIQLFQHDFKEPNNEIIHTVCALYMRGSHPDFTKVQSAIESLIRHAELPEFKRE